MRKYVESGTCFFETKLKLSNGKCHKFRTPIAIFQYSLPGRCADFVSKSVKVDCGLAPALANQFNRITVVHKADRERVTVDVNLRSHRPKKNNPYPAIEASAYANLAIIEVKQARLNRRSPVITALNQRGLHPFSVSKYCLGMLGQYRHLKHNRFKRVILRLNKTGV